MQEMSIFRSKFTFGHWTRIVDSVQCTLKCTNEAILYVLVEFVHAASIYNGVRSPSQHNGCRFTKMPFASRYNGESVEFISTTNWMNVAEIASMWILMIPYNMKMPNGLKRPFQNRLDLKQWGYFSRIFKIFNKFHLWNHRFSCPDLSLLTMTTNFWIIATNDEVFTFLPHTTFYSLYTTRTISIGIIFLILFSRSFASCAFKCAWRKKIVHSLYMYS